MPFLSLFPNSGLSDARTSTILEDNGEARTRHANCRASSRRLPALPPECFASHLTAPAHALATEQKQDASRDEPLLPIIRSLVLARIPGRTVRPYLARQSRA